MYIIQSAAECAPNIAIVKYWGKSNEKLNLPSNESLSFSLPTTELLAKTIVSIEYELKQDQTAPTENKDEKKFEMLFTLNSEPQEKIPAMVRRLVEIFVDLISTLPTNEIRSLKKIVDALHIKLYPEQQPSEEEDISYFKHYRQNFIRVNKISISSENTFPTGCGIASSAAGAAALTKALYSAFRRILEHLATGTTQRQLFLHNLEENELREEILLSAFARFGSGSGARSVFSFSHGNTVLMTSICSKPIDPSFSALNIINNSNSNSNNSNLNEIIFTDRDQCNNSCGCVDNKKASDYYSAFPKAENFDLVKLAMKYFNNDILLKTKYYGEAFFRYIAFPLMTKKENEQIPIVLKYKTIISVVSSKIKQVSSTVAMTYVNTAKSYSKRQSRVSAHITELIEILRNVDNGKLDDSYHIKLKKLALDEWVDLHTLVKETYIPSIAFCNDIRSGNNNKQKEVASTDSYTGLTYRNADSEKITEIFLKRADCSSQALITFDAGPNAIIFDFSPNNGKVIMDMLKEINPKNKIIIV